MTVASSRWAAALLALAAAGFSVGLSACASTSEPGPGVGSSGPSGPSVPPSALPDGVEPESVVPEIELGAVPAASSGMPVPAPAEALVVAEQDPMVGLVVSGGAFVLDEVVDASGRWLLLGVDEGDGLLVLMRQAGAWQVMDAGGAGVGCGVADPSVLAALGLSCG